MELGRGERGKTIFITRGVSVGDVPLGLLLPPFSAGFVVIRRGGEDGVRGCGFAEVGYC